MGEERNVGMESGLCGKNFELFQAQVYWSAACVFHDYQHVTISHKLTGTSYCYCEPAIRRPG